MAKSTRLPSAIPVKYEPKPSEPPLWHRYVAGAFGEMLAVCFTHPADVLKVRLQLMGECNPAKRSLTAGDFVQAARKMIKTEGVRKGMYAGISASWTRQLVFGGLRHGGYGVLDRKWKEQFDGISLLGRLTCAITSGGFASVIANPCDVVLIRMQSDGHKEKSQQRMYNHVFDGFRRILNEEGVRTLWRGCSPTVLRAVLVTASQIGTYEEMKSTLLHAGCVDGLPVHVASAISSATVACIVTSPVDVVKTRIMNMQRTHGVQYSGPLDVMVQTFRTEGPLAFYKGLSATFLRLWPHTIILWMGQERISTFLRQR